MPLLTGLCEPTRLLAFAEPPDQKTTEDILNRIKGDLHPGQLAFVEDQTTEIIGLSAGYGAGKTRSLASKAVALAVANQGFIGIVMEPTGPLIRDIWQNDFDDFLEAYEIPYSFRASPLAEYVLHLPGGDTKILCRSFENWTRCIGINAAWCLADEIDTVPPSIANKEKQKIIASNELFNVEKAVANRDYTTALNLLKGSTSIDKEDVEKQVIKIQKEGEEYRATSYGVSEILQGNNPTLGKKIPGTTDEKILEATDTLLFNKAATNKLNPTDTFRLVDDAFAPTGLISPYYEELFEAGFNAGSITTFDTAADIPAVVIQSVKAAEAADKLGRLSVYTTEKEQEFFDNVIVAKEILGMNNYEAIKNAKEFQMNYDKAVMQGATKQKTKTFENLETFFKDKPWSLRDREITNIGEVKSYVDKIFNMYLAMNIDSKKAQQLTVNNIKKNLEVVDSYLYKKRDIDSFKSIGGLDMVKPVKTYIIKNNMIDEDPKDFYLRYNGGGIFEIRNRVDTSQVYDKNNNPMIYYAKDLYAINQEREFKFRSEIKKETQLEQEKKIKFKEEFEPLFGDSTGF